MVRRRNPQDIAAGIFLILVGALAWWLGADLPRGRMMRMGPGYVPMLLSWLLLGLGAIIAGRGVAFAGPRLERWAWRPLLTLTVAILIFALLLERAGLVLAILVAVGVSSLAAPAARVLPVLLLGAVLAAMSTALFFYLLGLPLVVWPSFGS